VVWRRDGLKLKELQDLLMRARQALAPFAGIVFAATDGQVLVAAAVTPELTDRLQAGARGRAATQTMGGGGGGRPEMAQGQGKDEAALPRAMDAARAVFAAAGLALG
jgi:alanyl-tRNA synthetase